MVAPVPAVAVGSGAPLVLSDEQAQFVIDFYAVDEFGVYVYRRGAIEAAKGWGKSPLGAVLALAEFAGPVAPPIPWVQLAACSEDQAVSNVYSLLWALLSENDGRAARELGIDLGRGRLFLKSNAGREARGGVVVVGCAGGAAGHVRPAGRVAALVEVERRAAAGAGAAPERGEDGRPHARALQRAGDRRGVDRGADRGGVRGRRAGDPVRREPSGVEPLPEMSDEQLAGLLQGVYAGAPWVDLDRLLKEIRDPGTPWPETCRFFFNLPSSGVLAAVDPAVWASRKREARPAEARSRSRWASTARTPATARRSSAAPRDGWLFPVEILERPPNVGDDWRIDRDEDPPRARVHLRELQRRLPVRRSVAVAVGARRMVGEVARPGRRVPDEPDAEDGARGRPVPLRDRRGAREPRRRPGPDPARAECAAQAGWP